MSQPIWDESKHPREPAGAPKSAGGEFKKYKDSPGRHTKRDPVTNRFTPSSSAATLALRKIKVLDEPRSHKKKKTPDFGDSPPPSHKLGVDWETPPKPKLKAGKPPAPPPLKLARSKSLGKAVTNAAGDFAAIGIAHAASAITGGAANVEYVHKKSGGRPRSSGYDFIDTRDTSGHGTSPPRVPTHYNKNDEKGYKVNFYIGKVHKKRRPTFPTGYQKKSALDF
jgi:hypothetical protein